MKMIYLWKIPDDYPEKLIGAYDAERGPNRFLFKEGRRLGFEAQVPVFHFEAVPARLLKLDALANNALIPLVNERVATILRSLCPQDVELVDSIVLARGQEVPGYKIVNVLSRVKGIDHSASECTLMSDGKAILGFRKLQYLDGCLRTHDLARDDEYSSNLLVSQRLRDRFVDERLSGIGLYLPTEISW
jgi:hypothetical protein